MTDPPLRVVLADDHHIVRAGLTQLLEAAGISVVGVAADGEEACELTNRFHPDLVLMDLSMPRLDGVAATRRIMVEAPGSRVLVLTSFSDHETVVDAIDAGAVGYLLKDSEPDELVRAVKSAARGEAPIDPRVTRALIERRAPPSAELTEREQDVLRLVANGLANKAIARQLGIAEKTVKAHLTSVFQRIGVTDRTQAALWAQKNNYT